MKLEHVLEAPQSGIVRELARRGRRPRRRGPGARVPRGRGRPPDARSAGAAGARDPSRIRPDLAEVVARHAAGLDPQRPDAVARRRKTGQRTARENVDDLVDPGTFVEYGPLVIAAQRRRRALDDLIARTPADGLVAGIGRVNGALFGESARTECVVMSYDYTVLAGTQGQQNHRKKDRMFELAREQKLPVVFLTEGGGGRPGDTDVVGRLGARLSRVPALRGALGAGAAGRHHLGPLLRGQRRAARLLRRDHRDRGLEHRHRRAGDDRGRRARRGPPRGIGPMDVQTQNGVVDVAVADEAEAVRVAKQYLSYFQGPLARWECADQQALRSIIPENRLRAYDVRQVAARAGRRRLAARAAPRVGPRDHHVAAPRRGPAARRDREQPEPPGGRDRPRRRRQGHPLHAALRRVRPADPVPVRLPGHHGRARDREDGARPPRLAHVRERGEPHRPVLHDRPAQGLRPRRAGDGGRQLQGAALHGVVADRRVRRHGPRGRGEARLQQGARRRRRTTRSARSCSTRWSSACTRSGRR